MLKEIKAHSYTAYNFSQLNDAIDIEIQKRNELSRLYASQKKMNRSTMYFYICASVCLLLLTITFIYWFGFSEPKENVQYSKPIEENSTSLKQIADNENSSHDTINTSFTVFQRKQIETGEYVVTGKNFTPEDLLTPEDQYCYIEPITSDSGMSGEPIASILDEELIIETADTFLIHNALPYCQFTQ